jgi:hypothetical protein
MSVSQLKGIFYFGIFTPGMVIAFRTYGIIKGTIELNA